MCKLGRGAELWQKLWFCAETQQWKWGCNNGIAFTSFGLGEGIGSVRPQKWTTQKFIPIGDLQTAGIEDLNQYTEVLTVVDT